MNEILKFLTPLSLGLCEACLLPVAGGDVTVSCCDEANLVNKANKQ